MHLFFFFFRCKHFVRETTQRSCWYILIHGTTFDRCVCVHQAMCIIPNFRKIPYFFAVVAASFDIESYFPSTLLRWLHMATGFLCISIVEWLLAKYCHLPFFPNFSILGKFKMIIPNFSELLHLIGKILIHAMVKFSS